MFGQVRKSVEVLATSNSGTGEMQNRQEYLEDLLLYRVALETGSSGIDRP